MSSLEHLKEQAVYAVERQFENLTRSRSFCEPDPQLDLDEYQDEEERRRSKAKKRKCDEIYDRVPAYLTQDDALSKQMLQVTPNDFENIIAVAHNSTEIYDKPTYVSIYSDQKDSFCFRLDARCLYFQLKDDTKRRLVKRYIKENLNEVAQMVQEENQKIFEVGKASFEKLSVGAIVSEAHLDAQSSQ